ncbi:MAG: hypothetical protein HW421_2273 [Ignavibacteria bacterium]|nr:hypothetical protein [Ignavibacteria bacterium]
MKENIFYKFINSEFRLSPVVYLVYILNLMSCNGGLAPEPAVSEKKSLITGTLKFIGGKNSWPPSDSVKDIRVVAFKNYPPGDIITEILRQNASFTINSLPFFVDSATFTIEVLNPPVTFRYIAAAQQYDSITNWHAIGVYTKTGDKTKPDTLLIEKGKIYYIEIFVDFKNLPPQPF